MNNEKPTTATIDTATGRIAPAELSTDRVKTIFSHIAKRYERFNALSSFGSYRRWLNGMMMLAPITAHDNVLDIAGGTGDVSRWVARTFHPQHIQCTDLVPEMLAIAKMHHQRGDFCGVDIDFDIVDAQSIPYENDTYDVITMAYGIRNIPNRLRALQEMHRVLKPGGALVCLEFSTPKNPLLRALYYIYLRYVIPLWGGLITGDKSPFIYLAQSIQAFFDQQELAHLFEDAGFQHITWHNFTGGIAAVHVAYK